MLPVYSHAYPNARKLGAAALRRHHRYATRTVGCFALIGLALIAMWSLLHLYVFKEHKYVVIIDGGSSGTRLHVYRWSISPLKHLPSLEEMQGEGKGLKAAAHHARKMGLPGLSLSKGAYKRTETEPGLDRYDPQLRSVLDHFLSLLNINVLRRESITHTLNNIF